MSWTSTTTVASRRSPTRSSSWMSTPGTVRPEAGAVPAGVALGPTPRVGGCRPPRPGVDWSRRTREGGGAMTATQGDLALLEDPVAQELLGSREPARLAYTWLDGTPRVVPIWFHWDGRALVLGSPPGA